MVRQYNKRNRAILENGIRFLYENSGIVERIDRTTLYNDEPKLFSYTCYYRDKFKKTTTEDSVASGVAFNKTKALLKLIGETVERYALTINNNKKLLHGSFAHLKKTHRSILNPVDFIPFSPNQIVSHNISVNELESSKIHWVLGRSLITNNDILIPAQLVFVPYIYQEIEPLIMWPISTGAAAGKSLEDALYRGICEVIERDSFMIHYLNNIHTPQIDISSITNKKTKEILESLHRYRIDLFLVNLTTDIKIPSIGAILIDKTGLGPAVCVGLKAGFDVHDVVIGAIEEALMVRTWIRDEFIYLKPYFKRQKIIETIIDRAHLWFPLKAINYLDFWLCNTNTTSIKKMPTIKKGSFLQRAVSLLKEKNIDIFYVNLTDKTLKKSGLTIVKVIIPELQPLYLNETYKYFGNKRLYQTPVRMGLIQKPQKESELNKIPHPFL
ncbi:YcaO-like family protein [Candidatus Roizmanbacteria bacterium]|nr:YcaO-like family protein [Candidatus Roizmanbacteria bacterium]